MSGIDRGAFFAIGLVLGVALAFAFFVWAFPWFSDPQEEASYCKPDDQHCAEQYQNREDTGFWIRPFYGWIHSDDTLAQWIMALFGVIATGVSLFAVIVVRDTLNETRRTTEAALEANAITRRANRPWVTLRRDIPCSFKSTEITEGAAHDSGYTNRVELRWKYDLENVGESPAFAAKVFSKIICHSFLSDIIEVRNEFIDECERRFRITKQSVIFPKEKLEFETSSHRAMIKRMSDDADVFSVIVVVMYTSQERELVGVETRVLAIEQASRSDGFNRGTHRLREYSSDRITR